MLSQRVTGAVAARVNAMVAKRSSELDQEAKLLREFYYRASW